MEPQLSEDLTLMWISLVLIISAGAFISGYWTGRLIELRDQQTKAKEKKSWTH